MSTSPFGTHPLWKLWLWSASFVLRVSLERLLQDVAAQVQEKNPAKEKTCPRLLSTGSLRRQKKTWPKLLSTGYLLRLEQTWPFWSPSSPFSPSLPHPAPTPPQAILTEIRCVCQGGMGHKKMLIVSWLCGAQCAASPLCSPISRHYSHSRCQELFRDSWDGEVTTVRASFETHMLWKPTYGIYKIDYNQSYKIILKDPFIRNDFYQYSWDMRKIIFQTSWYT